MSELHPARTAAGEIPTNIPVVSDVLAPASASLPVPDQRSSHTGASKLASEKVVVAAPMSLAGSAARIWKLTGLTANPYGRLGLGVAAIVLIALAWTCVLAWYSVFGLLLVPYRIVRRGSRSRKRQALQHREMLAAVGQISKP